MVNQRNSEVSPEAVAQLCVEYWKLSAATERALAVLEDKNGKRLQAQLKYSKRQLEVILQELGLRLVDFHGELYHAGLAVSVDNPADHDEDEELIISKTLEPTVMSEMTVLRLGRVIVGPKQSEEE